VIEREAVDDALLARGLRIDAAPEGKTVGVIHVANHDVFSPRDPGLVRWLNVFHRTTREDVIRREVLLRPGARWDEALADETARNLRRDVDLSSLVVVLPVKSAEPNKVDLLVVTRDVWSLRFNTDFEHQEGTLISLQTSLSENNLFGWRKRVSMNFDMYQGSYSLGPSYLDPNIAGTRLTLSAAYRWVFSRETDEQEGSSVAAAFAYPLFSLDSKWGAGLSVAHSDLVYRAFLRDQLQVVDLPDSSTEEMLPYIYRARSDSITSSVVRSFRMRHVIQRVTAGHQLRAVRPTLTDDFPEMDPDVRARFLRFFVAPSQRISALFLRYRLFTPRYRVYRDFDTFDLREDALLGPNLSLYGARAASWLGSEVEHVDLAAGAGWSLDLGDGAQRVFAEWSGRADDDGSLTEESVSGSVYLASPMLLRAARGILGGEATTILRTSSGQRVSLGGEDGLRGYAVGEFFSREDPLHARFLAHAEVRSRGFRIASLRLGGLVFYDAGHAATRFSTLYPYQDAGFGLRLLIPQLNAYVLRFDWAFAFQDTPNTRAGWPGRLSLGFYQVF